MAEEPNELLAHLADHPAWPTLKETARRQMEYIFAVTARELMASKTGELPATEIQFRRGFFAGMKFLLDYPTLEAEKLKRALAEDREEVTTL